MSVKAQMHEARQLIADKRYAEARRILRTVDHPQAAQWLAKLDSIAPEQKSRKRLYIFAAVVLFIALVAVLVIFNQMINGMAQQALSLTAP